MSLTAILVSLGLFITFASVDCQTVQPTRCFTCLYAERQGERPTGIINCLQPTVATVRSEMCSGNCYKIDVMEEDKGVQYLQRGCLPSCNNHDEYPVSHYGVGSIHCCYGDLCNSSTITKINSYFIAVLALASLFVILRV